MAKKQLTPIQRDQRVLRHSMVGAFLGWLSTYAVYLVFATVQWIGDVFSRETLYWPSILDWLFIFGVGVGSFGVTLTGWIFLGIPIAAMITDRQAHRFKFMITVHTIATLLVVLTPALLSLLFSPSTLELSFEALLRALFNPLTVSAATIGSIGGAVFCMLERRS